ncbi:MAG: hypothetical protein KA149_13220 [Chitinophagales bacterium]|nr:hypothetical protein [Chitinophagales bacterium]
MKHCFFMLLFLYFLPLASSAQAITDTAAGEPLSKKQIRLAKKHADWDSCFIVKAKGDTIFGKVNHRPDQSSLLSSYPSDVVVFFAHRNEKEEQFIPNDIKELYVYNLPDGFKRYLVLEDEYYLSNFGILYRVVVDGPCKLVADRVKNTVPLMTSIGYSFTASKTPDSLLYEYPYRFVIEESHYYLLYKKSFTPIRVTLGELNAGDPVWGISASFKKKCAKAFGECPALVAQIENNTFRSKDIREIVKEFNSCIGSK